MSADSPTPPALLWTTRTAMSNALALYLDESAETGDFVGQWAPTLQILGLHNRFTDCS